MAGHCQPLFPYNSIDINFIGFIFEKHLLRNTIVCKPLSLSEFILIMSNM